MSIELFFYARCIKFKNALVLTESALSARDRLQFVHASDVIERRACAHSAIVSHVLKNLTLISNTRGQEFHFEISCRACLRESRLGESRLRM
jgi:hypothetical protein